MKPIEGREVHPNEKRVQTSMESMLLSRTNYQLVREQGDALRRRACDRLSGEGHEGKDIFLCCIALLQGNINRWQGCCGKDLRGTSEVYIVSGTSIRLC